MTKHFHRALALVLTLLLTIDAASAGRWLKDRLGNPAACSPCEASCDVCVVESCCNSCSVEVVPCGGCDSMVVSCGQAPTKVSMDAGCGCEGTSVAAPMASEEVSSDVVWDTSEHAVIEPTVAETLDLAPAAPTPMPTPAPVMEVAPPAPSLELEGFSSAPVAEEPATPPVPEVLEFEEPMPEEPASFSTEEAPEDDLFGDVQEPEDEPFMLDEPMTEEPEATPAVEEDFFDEEPRFEAEPAEEEEMPAEEPIDSLFDDGGFGDFDEPAPAEESAPAHDGADNLFDDGGFGVEPTEEAGSELFEEETPLDAAPADEAPPVEEPADDSFEDLFGSFGEVLREPGGYHSAETRTWVDNSGRFSCVARLLGIEGSAVRLEKPEGSTMTVSLARLSQRDLEFVNRQASAQLEVEEFAVEVAQAIH